ncbi:unnamed protein product, partial [Polarella glacialis]
MDVNEGRAQPGFLQHCAELAYFVPLSDQCLVAFQTKCLALVTSACTDSDAASLVALCFITANCGEVPCSGGPLAAALSGVTPDVKSAMDERWERWQWKGPVRLEPLTQWAVSLELSQGAHLASGSEDFGDTPSMLLELPAWNAQWNARQQPEQQPQQHQQEQEQPQQQQQQQQQQRQQEQQPQQQQQQQ